MQPEEFRSTISDDLGLVVGMGASAGALDALKSFFAEMPGDTGIGFVVVQHLGREQPSALAEILAGVARMAVREVRDGMRLEANHIFVIQPETQLRLNGGLLRVEPPAASGLRLPVDAFLRSLAVERGDSAVGIILSGTGSDGTDGLRAIKEHGGVAIAQSPETARYEGMPKSAIDAGLADFVLPVEEIPRTLLHLQQQREQERRDRGRAIEQEISEDVSLLCDILQRRTGHDFSRYKGSTLTRRIRRRLLVRNSESVADYVRVLDQDPSEPGLLMRDLLISVTHFFRDPDAFQVLAEQVIPVLFEGKAADVPVRVWVPGCASGEEAYSIAILLQEHRERSRDNHPVQIFASDIDAEQLAKARAGLYPKDLVGQLSPERLQRYFEPRGDGFQVVKELRDMCVFSLHSLIRDPPFSSLDLVSCRNLLIYLHTDLQGKVMPLFHYALRPGGYLFLGPSETLGQASALYTTLDEKRRIFRRAETNSRTHLQLPVMGRSVSQGSQPPVAGPARGQSGISQAFDRVILTEYAPPCAVVDERGQILYSAGRTGLLLQPPAGGPSQNIFEMAQGALAVELRAALLMAAKTARKVVRQHIPVELDDGGRVIRLIVRPFPGAQAAVLQEAAMSEEENSDVPASAAPNDRLALELQSARADLRTAMEELSSTNQELRSSNDELVSTNEELQSANEELRTSQEEMQSINEELESVNAELREKIKEVMTAHTELQNLYASSEIATVYIDSHMRIARFTPAAKSLLHLIDADVDRPLADLAARLIGEHLVPDAESALRTGASFERQVHTADGVWLLKRVLPYRTLDHSIAGVSVTFMDVTGLKRAEEALRESDLRFRTMADSIPQLAWIANADGYINWYNQRWYEYTGTTAEQMEGWGWQSVHESKTLPKVLEQWKASIASGSPFDMTFPMRGADGRFRPFLTRVMPLKDSAGRVVQWFGTNTDVSERVAIENRLREREAELRETDRHKNQFLAMLSHELRNPLAPISNSLYVLDHASPAGDQGRRARAVIDRQVAHLTRLIDDLLDVTRISRGKIQLQRESLDLRDIVLRTTEDHRPVFNSAGLALETVLPKEVVPVFGDRVRLAQAIGNLLSNAAKFTPRGGWARVALECDSDQAILRVADTGVGLTPTLADQLFEPFVQAETTLDRSKGGLGLGLALVKGLVDMHEGSVTVHSDGPHQGTEFVLRLPLDHRVRLAQEKPRAASGGGARRILVIEDNVDSADSLREALELDDYAVQVAYSGFDGITKAHAFKPQAVLCDIGLPGMDGYEVARQIRSNSALHDLTLVALSGYAQPDDVAKGREAGFDAHLAKPPTMDALKRALDVPRAGPAGPGGRPS